jgi:hypothetical protein
MKSPGIVLPTDTPLHKDEVLTRIKAAAAVLHDCVNNLDLTLTCLGFELPRMGPLTRWEWLHFILFHTERHVRQLEKIYEKLVADEVLGAVTKKK